VQGVVTLTGAAPEGGALITLASTDPRVVAPATVLVPAGSTGAVFLLDAGLVEDHVRVSITARWGVSRTATLELLPPP
jgi:hypothetical protein